MNPNLAPRFLSNAPADLARPDRPRLHRHARPGLDPGAGRPGPRRDPARRRQRRPQHGRPVSGMRPTPRTARRLKLANDRSDQGVRRHRPAPGDGPGGQAAGIGPAGDRPGRRLSQPEPVALRQHGDLADRPPRRGRTRRPRLAGPGARLDPGGLVDCSSAPGSIPAAIRGRRALASSLERIDDLTLDPAVARPDVSTDGDDLAAFVRRSTLDAYASSDRLAELAKDQSSSARYPGTGLAEPAQAGRPADQGGIRLAGLLYVAGRLRHPLAAVGHAFRAARRALGRPQGVPRRPGRLEAGRPRPGALLQRVRPPGPRERLGRDRPRRRRPGLPGRARRSSPACSAPIPA